MSGNSGVSMVAEDLGMAFITAGGSSMVNKTGEAATLGDELAGKQQLWEMVALAVVSWEPTLIWQPSWMLTLAGA